MHTNHRSDSLEISHVNRSIIYGLTSDEMKIKLEDVENLLQTY